MLLSVDYVFETMFEPIVENQEKIFSKIVYISDYGMSNFSILPSPPTTHPLKDSTPASQPSSPSPPPHDPQSPSPYHPRSPNPLQSYSPASRPHSSHSSQ